MSLTIDDGVDLYRAAAVRAADRLALSKALTLSVRGTTRVEKSRSNLVQRLRQGQVGVDLEIDQTQQPLQADFRTEHASDGRNHTKAALKQVGCGITPVMKQGHFNSPVKGQAEPGRVAGNAGL